MPWNCIILSRITDHDKAQIMYEYALPRCRTAYDFHVCSGRGTAHQRTLLAIYGLDAKEKVVTVTRVASAP